MSLELTVSKQHLTSMPISECPRSILQNMTTKTMVLAVLTICAVLSSVNGATIGNVAFHAALTEERNLPNNTVVTYNNVVTNIGNAFNSNTGVFTASKTGLYVFHIHALSDLGKRFRFCLTHNDVCLVLAYGYSTNYAQGANSIVLRLKSGDRVYVKTVSPSQTYGNNYVTFTGYMIGL